MKDEMFNELTAAVREGGAILRGEAPPACAHLVTTRHAPGGFPNIFT
jgi:hypothetical protein